MRCRPVVAYVCMLPLPLVADHFVHNPDLSIFSIKVEENGTR